MKRSVFWLSLGLLIFCLLGLFVTVIVKPHNTTTTIQPRFDADNSSIFTSQEQIVDKDVQEKMKILYSRKAYSNPSSEDDTYAGNKSIRRRKRPLKIIGKDFNPYGSYTIRHANGTLAYVFPSPNISRSTTSTIKPFVFHTNPNTTAERKVYDETSEAYPSKLIDHIMDEHKHSFRGAFESDSLYGDDDQLNQRNDISSDTFICESIEKIYEPKQGITKTNSSVMIVNTEKYRKGVKIEICLNEDEPCSSCDGNTICKQLYYYRILVVVNLDEKRPYKEFIKLPSSCKCAKKA